MPFGLLGYLLITAIAVSLPVLLIVLVGRRWIPARVGRSILAIAFAGGTAYAIYHIEWFDVWRHGMPPADQLLVYAGYMIAFGALGWVIGGAVYRR